jgi:hypothetical protein
MGSGDAILEATSPLYALIHGLTSGGGKGGGKGAPTPPPSGPAAKPAGFKDGGVVEKSGVAKVHKGETVIPAPKSAWKDATKHLGGRSNKSPKKEIKEIRTRRGASGGFIHEHHHTDPENNPMEEHTSPDQIGMLQHMLTNMPDAGAAGPPAGGDAGAPAPAGPPAVAPGPQVPGTV